VKIEISLSLKLWSNPSTLERCEFSLLIKLC